MVCKLLRFDRSTGEERGMGWGGRMYKVASNWTDVLGWVETTRVQNNE